MQRKVFLRHKTLGMIQKKSPALQAGLDHSSRLNVTLAGCSSAEPASVSVQLCKIQISNLYLQPVKILSHLPYQKNKLVIERSFVNNQFQNSSDTLIYSLNPTGDFISDENNKRPSDIILRKLSEDNATFIFVDQWVKNENSKSVKLLLEMRKQ